MNYHWEIDLIIPDVWIATMSSSSLLLTSLSEEQERENREKFLPSLSSVVDIPVTVLDVWNQETYLEIDGFCLDGGVLL